MIFQVSRTPARESGDLNSGLALSCTLEVTLGSGYDFTESPFVE